MECCHAVAFYSYPIVLKKELKRLGPISKTPICSQFEEVHERVANGWCRIECVSGLVHATPTYFLPAQVKHNPRMHGRVCMYVICPLSTANEEVKYILFFDDYKQSLHGAATIRAYNKEVQIKRSTLVLLRYSKRSLVSPDLQTSLQNPNTSCWNALS